ncbi:hypothetical protein T02_6337 [Trichinella nativa]|uniref:Uncharacterized protein n=1 Tax=Trichinella nativa TaxID=6335 RepID=A0A0V1LGG2_9BILA|nr:hypothetical protein T02_6337 [Trichinella nativa]
MAITISVAVGEFIIDNHLQIPSVKVMDRKGADVFFVCLCFLIHVQLILGFTNKNFVYDF